MGLALFPPTLCIVCNVRMDILTQRNHLLTRHDTTTEPQPNRSTNASWVTTPFPPLGIEGPYGQLSTPLGDYPHLLLVGGGVGVTPLTSTLKWLWAEVRARWC